MSVFAGVSSAIDFTLKALKVTQLVDKLSTPTALKITGNYISEWIEDGTLHRETIRIKRQRGDRVFGTVESDTMPGVDWEPNARNKLSDYGCYCLEKYPDGLRFAGYACGFFAHRGADRKGELAVYWHTVRPTESPKLIQPMVVVLIREGEQPTERV
jgi:hypothetical protein